MVVWNTTTWPIFITTAWTPGINGKPARIKTDYCIPPGDGIELNILGLKTKPKKERKVK